ncbi:VanZ like family protein [Cupriavidus sp. YR651]|uniref:VanZ family protein n=1 Tax=Cupriavidus sp. YR651 TaxID=1855315 RepID=UPI000881D684|nr:VanZ family protein [Cupriavidus sp. YR651]SDD10725.1 VanZ like family protein [Cupriavidus sp. YR651]
MALAAPPPPQPPSPPLHPRQAELDGWLPRHSPLARVGLICFTLLVVYASLYPFTGWVDNGISPFAYLTAPKPRYITEFDLLTNVLGYCPFGALVVLSLHPRVSGARATLIALVAGALLSAVMEALQTWLPSRIPSNIDLITNALGALLGAAMVAPFTSALIDRGTLTRLRMAWFEPHASFAIILVMLWPFAQVFPQEHLFGMGGIVREWLTDPDSWPMELLQTYVPSLLDWQEDIGLRPDDMQAQQLLETLVTACSWIGTGLFASIAMRRTAPMLRILAGLLTGALIIKAAVAELQFPDDNAFNWLSEGGRFALLTSSLVLVLLLRLPRWLRAMLATLALAALVALTNVLPPNPYAWISEQGWRMGRFIHFNSLAQWLGWLWPFMAFCYIAWRFEQAGLRRRLQRRARRRATARAVAAAMDQPPKSKPPKSRRTS